MVNDRSTPLSNVDGTTTYSPAGTLAATPQSNTINHNNHEHINVPVAATRAVLVMADSATTSSLLGCAINRFDDFTN